MSMLYGLVTKLWRLYLQFLIIIFIGLLFAYVLNGIFSIGNDTMMVMVSSIFLMGFTGAVVLLNRV